MGPSQVLFEPSGKNHPSYRYLLQYPPPGYQFVTDTGLWNKFVLTIAGVEPVYYNLWRLTHFLPINLIKSRIERVTRRRPPGTQLTFAINHLLFREEPWVVLVEWVHMFTGWWMPEFRRHQKSIEAALASPNCKKVLTWCEPARRSLLDNLDCSEFEHKIELLPVAAPSRRFTKTFNNEDKVRLLFVGSAHAPKGFATNWLAKGWVYDFHIKGGREVLEAFARLKPTYPNLELVVRAGVPPAIKEKFEGTPGLRFIEQQIPWAQLEEEFKAADIYLFPCHQTTPWAGILDAMSYELPIVTTDVYANPELVQDGVTGFLVKASDRVSYYDPDEKFIPPMVTPRRAEFLRAIEQVDSRVVDELATKTALLIENKELRRSMGRAARWEVDYGKHSIANRNDRLKAIFDEAVR